MKDLFFSKNNFYLVYNLLVKTIQVQKGMDIQSNFVKDVEKIFVQTFNLNNNNIKNALISKIPRKKILLTFNRLVLEESIKQISIVIDNYINYKQQQQQLLHDIDKNESFIQKQQPQQFVQQQPSQQFVQQQPSVFNPQLPQHLPQISSKMENMDQDYENLLRYREKDKLALNNNELYQFNSQQFDINGFDNPSTSFNEAIKYDNPNNHFNDEPNISELFEKQISSRVEADNTLPSDNKLSSEDINNILSQNDSKEQVNEDIYDVLSNETTPSHQQQWKEFYINQSQNELSINQIINEIQINSIEFVVNHNVITNNNNKMYFKDTDDGPEFLIQIEPGVYTIKDLIDIIKSQMDTQSDYKYDIQLDTFTNKLTFQCLNNDKTNSKYIKKKHCFELYFRDNALNDILGFKNKIYKNNFQYKSEKKYKLLKDNVIYLYIKEIQNDPILKFLVDNNDTINYNDIKHIQLPTSKYVDKLFIEFKNNNNEMYDFDGEFFSMIISIK